MQRSTVKADRALICRKKWPSDAPSILAEIGLRRLLIYGNQLDPMAIGFLKPSSTLRELVLAFADNQYRTRGVSHHPLGGTSHDDVSNPGTAMSRNRETLAHRNMSQVDRIRN